VNAPDVSLIEMLQMAETPLYSMYRVLDDDFDGNLPLPAFLEHIDALIQQGVVRLWGMSDACERVECAGVPPDLEERYGTVLLDRTYDPFSFTLTLGPAAPDAPEPDWEVDTDFAQGRYVIVVHRGTMAEAYQQVSRLLPSVAFLEEQRRTDGGVVRAEGALSAAATG
jgi:hypothetical protein